MNNWIITQYHIVIACVSVNNLQDHKESIVQIRLHRRKNDKNPKSI